MIDINGIDFEGFGRDMYRLMSEIYPICRSITGEGVRETLHTLKKYAPIQAHKVPSGTSVYDWIVPDEWNIKNAYIKNSKGEKIVDFNKSNLHVVSYSEPVHAVMSLEELKPHLHTLPESPDWIPYRTSYYERTWGFCLPHRLYESLEPDTYNVVIDSSFSKGALTYGEAFIKGRRDEEVLLSCYVCHPSLCNDNLSGIVLLTYLAKELAALSLKYSYRFLFIPETIGAIAWLSQNEERLDNIRHGLVATCLGDSGHSTYKRSRLGAAEIDRIVEKVLIDSGQAYEILDFFPSGSDEKHFCSPGFNLPMAVLMRTPYHRFKEYHTSADNLAFVRPESLSDSLKKYLQVIYVLENNVSYLNLFPKGEPNLGKRGLYEKIGGGNTGGSGNLAALPLRWVLNMSDGEHSLLDIAIRSSLPFMDIRIAADALVEKALIQETGPPP